MEQLVKGPMEVKVVHKQMQRLTHVVAVGCVVMDQQCRESDRKARVMGYTTVLNEQVHHCPSSASSP